ncbi:hypothetical protein Ae201684P_016115 [Aphanomyces euteiches]|uniref:Uncharacterized protein n=1 Tax=Aphanomyces euteiches TaxID=100861 RepID=A0A6G0WFR7_9STRA|nr:hypothetical protein Ae201684_015704 [Aphanomyces euteiches]KAH9093487.1 hypothetical protein Ae201684P_016115 [Aphanomyces euteiches]
MLTVMLFVWSVVWIEDVPSLASPLRVQCVMAFGFLVCVGFHFKLVLPLQLKDDICSKLIQRRHDGCYAVATKLLDRILS